MLTAVVTACIPTLYAVVLLYYGLRGSVCALLAAIGTSLWAVSLWKTVLRLYRQRKGLTARQKNEDRKWWLEAR